MRIRSILIPVALILYLIPAVAQAKPGKDVRNKEKAARKACMVGNYQEGVSILADLFIEVGDANYIFNQARCLQQNHRWEEALDRFREYLRKTANLKAKEKAQIEQYMQECQGHMAASAPAPAPPPFTPPQAAQAAPTAPTASSASVEPVAPLVPTPDSEDRGKGLRTAGIITGAMGLVGLGVGVFCSVKTYSLRDKPSELETYKTVGIISYVAGGVGLITGATLYIVGARRRGRSTSDGAAVALVPVIGRGEAALLLHGSF